MIITGSAPISDNVYKFLKICFGCPVIQGYGLTETCAAGTGTSLSDTSYGNVGVPVPSNEVRLIDVPDMNYFARENKGEICFRGNNIFSQYYKDEQKTKEAFDQDGFFMTGDIGRWNLDGTLSIIDRKKNIFKLAQGEYVAAEYIESIYTKNKFVQQIFVYGDSFQSCLVAVIIPDAEVLVPWSVGKNLPEGLPQLCQDETVKEMILKDLGLTAKEGKLQGFEQVREIYLDASPFSVDNGLLTPSFKSVRPKLKDYYDQQIQQMYSKLEKSQSKS